MDDLTTFEPFPKISRLRRTIVVTEKIDGTNAQIAIDENGIMRVGSRNRWITPEDDNFGFARWCFEHEQELVQGLGPGRHFGEWWGAGIQRRYGLSEKRFSLFNTGRWSSAKPDCCSVVPVLYAGPMSEDEIDGCLLRLANEGSVAAPGFATPEGVVVWHPHSGQLFKITLDKNDEHKGTDR